METTVHEYVFYGIFAAAILLPLVRIVFIMFRLKINEPIFVKAIQKLAGAGNLERAMKLCAAAPAAVSARGTHALLADFHKGVTDSLALREAFDRGAGGLNQATGKLAALPWAGLAVTLLGAAWAFAQGYDWLHPVFRPGAVALVLAMTGIRMGSKLRRKTAWVREQLIVFLQELALKS